MRRSVRTWLRGWVGGAIAGGANAASNGLTLMAVDPEDFNLGPGLSRTLMAVGISAAIASAIGAFLYLREAPLPPDEDDVLPPRSYQ